MFLKWKFLAVLFSFPFSGPMVAKDIHSSDAADSAAVHMMQEVVVTSSRHASLRTLTPDAIDVLTAASIREDQMRSTPEALAGMPGVFVQKTNHGGGSPFMRGLSGNQVLLLIDGIRLSNATVRYGPNQYMNTIDMFGLDKIEALRGGGSVQYGSDAMGGSIQAFSRNAVLMEQPVWGGTLIGRMATHGMENTVHADARYGSASAAFDGGITARKFGDIVGGDTTGLQSPNGYAELDFDMHAKLLVAPASVLTVSYQRVAQSDVPVYHKVALENYAVNKMDPQERSLAYFRWDQQVNAGVLRSAAMTASLQQAEEGRISRKNGSAIERAENDKVRTLGLSIDAFTTDGGVWSASSGIEAYADRVTSSRRDADLSSGGSVSKRGLYPDGSTMTSLAAFTLHTIDLPKWTITAGARYNAFRMQVKDDIVGATTLSPSALVWNAGIMRKLGDASTLFLSAATGFRAPNIDDLGTLGIVDFRYELPNAALMPEHSLQLQAGYKYRGPTLTGEVYVYRSELYDLIVRSRLGNDVREGYPVYVKENVDRAHVQGVETGWEYAITPSWSIAGSMTHTYGQNTTKNEPMRRIPPVFGRIGIGYSHDDFRCELEWQSAAAQHRLAKGDVEDNRIPAGGTPGWSVFSLTTGYTLGSVRLDLMMQNMLDEDYRLHGSGVNGYGRSAVATVTVAV